EARAASYRAVQSTPIRGRDGAPLGILSTHFRMPHRPAEKELEVLDLYVRQIAGFIERWQADERLRKSEERLRATEARLAAIVVSSNDAIVSKTLTGIVSTWNASAERIFGYAAEEMIGQSIRKLIPQDRQREEDEFLARIARGERVENYETARVRK